MTAQEVKALKDQLHRAQQTIEQQENVIHNQARRIEDLELEVSILRNGGHPLSRLPSEDSTYSNASTTSSRSRRGNSATDKSSGSYGASVDSGIASNPSISPPSIQNDTMGHLGITNHRDLTRFAVRRRLVSPHTSDGQLHDEMDYMHNGQYYPGNLSVNTAHDGELPHSSYITPKNMDFSQNEKYNNKHAEPQSAPPFFADPRRSSYNKGSTSELDKPYTTRASSADGIRSDSLDLSSEPSRSLGRALQNTRIAEEDPNEATSPESLANPGSEEFATSTPSTTPGGTIKGPPKGLAARLAMSAKDRRKIGIGQRAKLSMRSSSPSPEALSQQDSPEGDESAPMRSFNANNNNNSSSNISNNINSGSNVYGGGSGSANSPLQASRSLPEGAFAKAMTEAAMLSSMTPKNVSSGHFPESASSYNRRNSDQGMSSSKKNNFTDESMDQRQETIYNHRKNFPDDDDMMVPNYTSSPRRSNNSNHISFANNVATTMSTNNSLSNTMKNSGNYNYGANNHHSNNHHISSSINNNNNNNRNSKSISQMSVGSSDAFDDDSVYTWDNGSVEPDRIRSQSVSNSHYQHAHSSTHSNTDIQNLHEARHLPLPKTPLMSSRHNYQFCWKGERYDHEGGHSDVYLFIAHDNPRLGDSINDKMKVSSLGMEIMIETKADDGHTCFIICNAIYNGDFEAVEGANGQNQRGCAWLICNRLWGVKAPLDSYPTKSKGEIIEIDIRGVDSRQFLHLRSKYDIENLFQTCSSKVDVILDPYHTGSWYPYYEGRRKMAPQFRSKGVGYIRLGDDMSMFGSAFLSLDAGYTYLDFGKLSVRKDGQESNNNKRANSKQSSTAGSGTNEDSAKKPVNRRKRNS